MSPSATETHNLFQGPCSLCLGKQVFPFFKDSYREYFHCSHCSFTFVSPNYFLSAEEEKARYDAHENSPDDPGYRKFLSRLFDSLHPLLSSGSCGLDFGSGPGPTLSLMFEEQGHPMSLYDVFYAPHPTAFNQPYDFITATEVLEHLHRPKQELTRLWDCLNPGGYLGIMTCLTPSKELFADWYYKKDPTHVSFFSRATFEWLAGQWQATVTVLGNEVVIFKKK